MKMLIISDVHGNWPALRAVLETESKFTTSNTLCVKCCEPAAICPPNIINRQNHNQHMADKLEELFRLQKQLNERIGVHADPMTETERQ